MLRAYDARILEIIRNVNATTIEQQFDEEAHTSSQQYFKAARQDDEMEEETPPLLHQSAAAPEPIVEDTDDLDNVDMASLGV